MIGSFTFARADDWQKISEDTGVVVFQQSQPGKDLLAFKGEADLKAPMLLVASVLFDYTRATEWVERLKESRIINWLNATEFIEYDHFRAPLFVSERDFVSKVKMSFDPHQHSLELLILPPKEDDIPVALRLSKMVRGDLSGSRYLLTELPGQQVTHIIGEVHADPKGSLPAWLVNLFQRHWPVRTVKNLRQQLLKSDLKINTKLQDLLKGN